MHPCHGASVPEYNSLVLLFEYVMNFESSLGAKLRIQRNKWTKNVTSNF